MWAGSLAAAWCPAWLARLSLAGRTGTVAPSPSAVQEERRLAVVPPGLTSQPGPRPAGRAHVLQPQPAITHQPPPIIGPRPGRRAACWPVGLKHREEHRDARGSRLWATSRVSQAPQTECQRNGDRNAAARSPVRPRRSVGSAARWHRAHQSKSPTPSWQPSARRCANCHDFSPSSTPARSTTRAHPAQPDARRARQRRALQRARASWHIAPDGGRDCWCLSRRPESNRG